MGTMSDDDEQSKKPEVVEEGIKSMKLKNGDASDEEGHGTIRVGEIKKEASTSNGTISPRKADTRSATQSPVKSLAASQSPDMAKSEDEETVGGDVTVKMEPGQPLKLARTSSQKIVPRAAPLFNEYPDKTEEAKDTFQVIPACIYSNKYIGSTEHAMECDCAEEWGKIISAYAPRYTVLSGRMLSLHYRRFYKDECRVRGRLGLHQPCDQDGVFRRLRLRVRLSKSTFSATTVRQSHRH